MEDSDLEAGEKDPLVESKDKFASPKIIPKKNKQTNNDKIEKSESKVENKNDKLDKSDTNADNCKSKLPEISEPTEDDKTDASLLCPFFGVKNYLHHFYERPDVKDPHLYEEAPLPALTRNETIFMVKRREGICSSSVFRLSLMLGGVILLMGTTALIVAACASRKATLVGKVGGVAVVDRVAAAHNAEVDALLLVALIALTLGATVVAAALISRAFCRRPEYEDGFREGVLSGYDTIYEHPPFFHSSPRRMPFTEEITRIQPWISSSHINFH
ncbi:UNVERIFIED_CONTAM: hypothetical protein RMT77_009574 [Armadillidium vulgare]